MRARVRIASVALLFIVVSRIASASFHVKRSRQRALAIQRRGDDGSIARNIAYRYRTRENVSSLQLASLRRRHGRLSYIYIHRHRRLTGRSRTPRMTYPRARFRVHPAVSIVARRALASVSRAPTSRARAKRLFARRARERGLSRVPAVIPARVARAIALSSVALLARGYRLFARHARENRLLRAPLAEEVRRVLPFRNQ